MHHHTSHRHCCTRFTGNFSTIHKRHWKFHKNEVSMAVCE